MTRRSGDIRIDDVEIEVDPTRDDPAVATSVRLPAPLHRAARQAVHGGMATSITDLVVSGLRTTLADLARESSDDRAAREVRAALDAHYAEHPASRPTPVEVARAAALIADHPAAERPDLLAGALADLGDHAPLDDVLAWARGALAVETRLQAAGA